MRCRLAGAAAGHRRRAWPSPSLYYSQPMLGVLGADIGASDPRRGLRAHADAAGLCAGHPAAGAAGRPLRPAPHHPRQGGRAVRRAAAGAACRPRSALLLVASLVIGLAATLAQDIVPAAATLAPEAHRGKVVGTVMTGLLLGILLSRVVSGFVAEHFGWRAMFVARGRQHRAHRRRGLARAAALPGHHAACVRRAARLAGGALAAPWRAAPRGAGAGPALGRLQRVLVDAGRDAARRALPPGQRRGRCLRPGRRGRCAGRAARRPHRRPARARAG